MEASVHNWIDMRVKFPHILSIITLLFLSGCNTYKTYYSETVRNPSTSDDTIILRLDLSKSQESVEDLKKLKTLRVLNLTSREDIDLGVFLSNLPNPQELQVLILDSMGLRVLPSSIKRLKNLKHISLNHNSQLDLQKVIDLVKDLPIEFLNFQNNKLATVPSEISQLSLLKDFNLGYNQLESFEHFEYLASLEHLNSLWLTGNKLTGLSESLGSLEQLRNLYIEHNELTTVPEAILGMKRVWVVHAGHNLFTELPATFGKMSRLILLHINSCKIASVPKLYLKKSDYNILGLIMQANELNDDDKKLFQKEFDHFFILAL